MNLFGRITPGARMTALTLAGDTLALVLAAFVAVGMRFFFDGQFELILYIRLLPALSLFYALFALRGLYPGVLLSPPDELKRLSQAVTLGFLLLTAGTFLSRQGYLYSRAIFIGAWLLSLGLVPVMRSLARNWGWRLGWWGYPAVVLGARVTGRAVVRAMLRTPRLGLRPVALLDDDPGKIGRRMYGIPVAGPLSEAMEMARNMPGGVAILAMPGVGRERLNTIMEEYTHGFGRVMLVPDLFGATRLWVSALDFKGMLALDIRQKLLDPNRQKFKRASELVLLTLAAPFLLPLFLCIAALIKCDSPGPIFFRQQRIGLGGKDIFIWKFRTMIANAEECLDECLEHDSELREEWESQQKLRYDPRVTRLGRFLRASSLDELPQLYNVLRGDMSLVGPRPIVWAEVEKYREGFELYKRVRPGLTGLWQISGRSSTSYGLRVDLDGYYVRNWSLWFDIYILAKTPLEVFKGRGAY